MRRVSGDPRWWYASAYTAAFFFTGLLVTELFGEIPPDIDLKPFFIPLLFTVTLPARYRWAVALGAAVGEGFGDLIEGYELDDPLGFIGYVLGFAIAGRITGGSAATIGRVALAALAAAVINALPEAAMFYGFGRVTLAEAGVSLLGNILSHGLLLGAAPVWLLAPWFRQAVYDGLGLPREEMKNKPHAVRP
ncbi:hypothetical protein DYI95_009545 [Thermaerobacter sp. PB12/4term]|uniref:hypothetical protein n=1 Tax=Thermaerobacter sp. PB12/4term TaxID=2293838 RepID=UPI000E32CF7B|nr:hypothetical protein [Thermaerobacter sp. PB12/4term]QIA27722.1 hypothetical protein DYI95_009545 [Thermaerobacter sp. PB12/4term]